LCQKFLPQNTDPRRDSELWLFNLLPKRRQWSSSAGQYLPSSQPKAVADHIGRIAQLLPLFSTI
jgi:hypothetical protein